MNKYLVNEQLLQSVINILQELPYKNVFPVLDQIRELKPEVIKEEPKEKNG